MLNQTWIQYKYKKLNKSNNQNTNIINIQYNNELTACGIFASSGMWINIRVVTCSLSTKIPKVENDCPTHIGWADRSN